MPFRIYAHSVFNSSTTINYFQRTIPGNFSNIHLFNKTSTLLTAMQCLNLKRLLRTSNEHPHGAWKFLLLKAITFAESLLCLGLVLQVNPWKARSYVMFNFPPHILVKRRWKASRHQHVYWKMQFEASYATQRVLHTK